MNLHAHCIPSPQPSPTRGEGVEECSAFLTSPLVEEVARSAGEGLCFRQRGVTLIELVLSIVIVAIAASAILGLLSFAARSSADAMIRNQAVAVAQAYLEEIRFKSFSDPDGVGGESRGTFDDVSDYNGLNDVGARDQTGATIAGLGGYNVTVAVATSALGAVAAANSKRIDVTVQYAAAGITVAISGYRTNY